MLYPFTATCTIIGLIYCVLIKKRTIINLSKIMCYSIILACFNAYICDTFFYAYFSYTLIILYGGLSFATIMYFRTFAPGNYYLANMNHEDILPALKSVLCDTCMEFEEEEDYFFLTKDRRRIAYKNWGLGVYKVSFRDIVDLSYCSELEKRFITEIHELTTYEPAKLLYVHYGTCLVMLVGITIFWIWR